MPARPDVLVAGAGVSGLTCALALAMTGAFTVEVWARDLPLDTTSCAAAAMWAPYLVTDNRLARWSEATYRWLSALTEADGVRQVRGREVSRIPRRAPQWMTALPEYRLCGDGEVPRPYAMGWRYRAPMIEMPVYLTALLARLAALGVTVRRAAVRSLADALAVAPVVVNCTGAGSRDLVPDPGLSATRGQLVVVENPGVEEFFAEHDESAEPIYFVPHGDTVVLGGSAEPGRTDTAPDAGTATAIRRRCATIDPRLGRARVIAHRVGLRPTRDSVRVERVAVGTGHVIHNYGHGGAGVTLSWGCASDVVALAQEVLR